jgi:hypothetical protein
MELNAAEIIKELTKQLDTYKFFALAKGYPTEETVLAEVERLLKKAAEEEE